jgi:hypothetical protein
MLLLQEAKKKTEWWRHRGLFHKMNGVRSFLSNRGQGWIKVIFIIQSGEDV